MIMTKNKNYDDILKTAINEYVEEKLESDVYRDDEFITSDKFEKRISKLLKSEDSLYHKATLTTVRKVICVLIAILVLLLSTLSVGAVRDFIADFFIDHFSVYDTVLPKEGEVNNYPTTLETVYELGYIPKGYSLVDKSEIDNSISFIYLNENGNDIVFSQDTYEAYRSNIDNEHTTKHSEIVDGQEYFVNVLEDEDLKKPYITIIWDNGEYIFTLSGSMTKKEMLKMCRMLKEK